MTGLFALSPEALLQEPTVKQACKEMDIEVSTICIYHLAFIMRTKMIEFGYQRYWFGHMMDQALPIYINDFSPVCWVAAGVTTYLERCVL